MAMECARLPTELLEAESHGISQFLQQSAGCCSPRSPKPTPTFTHISRVSRQALVASSSWILLQYLRLEPLRCSRRPRCCRIRRWYSLELEAHALPAGRRRRRHPLGPLGRCAHACVPGGSLEELTPPHRGTDGREHPFPPPHRPPLFLHGVRYRLPPILRLRAHEADARHPRRAEVTVAPAREPSWIMCDIGGTELGARILRAFQSRRSVHSAMQFDVLDFPSHGTPVQQVTSPRLAHLPSCKCHPHSYVPRRADAEARCVR
ncbi:hypothetical protein K466DRAFT_357407 [Polyporus arcularius HHB13444]|uniref:Uncharacterized protein n=1 Tax=Polyporus arcularius HHB13444 TaxID=1314778 RepID=A0A5C3NUR9_9APHY|nr:hypothetical protein K466DRAFT_357407 [Polyporus arcularius HHB13444]